MQHEVGVGTNDLIANGVFNAGRIGSGPLWDVTLGAADIDEDTFASHARLWRLRRHSQIALEVSDSVNECEALLVIDVFWLRHWIALRKAGAVAVRRILHHQQSIGNTHFVASGVTGETQHGCNLRLPSEASHAQRAAAVGFLKRSNPVNAT